MERDGNKVQRSESFDVTKDQRIQPISNDVSKINRLSVSESSILQMEAAQSEAQTISPGTSEAGTLKKSKKFKPKKFLAKTFGSKKNVDEPEQLNNAKDAGTSNQEAQNEVVVNTSDKPSPKVKGFKSSFLKKLTKKGKVGPQTGSLEAGMENIEKKEEDLSVSQTSLVDMEDPEVKEVPKSEPVTLESRKVQMKITMSAKKLEKKRERDATMTLPTIESNIVTKASSPPPSNIPQTTDIELPSASNSTLQTLPKEGAEDTESMKKHVVSYKKSSDEGKGSGNLSDGKETATVHTQQAHKPQQLTLSSSSSEENKSKSPETPGPSGLQAEEIKFDIGTPVRPLRTSSSGVIPSPSIDSAAGDSIDQVFYSPTSDISDPSEKPEENSRRKIVPFVPQLTIYTPEEQELLRKNVEANIDSLSSQMQDSSLYPNFDDTLTSNMAPQTPDKREHLYKILVIGELGTGKTSFIKRYVHQFFSQNYRATIGVDFALKVLSWDAATTIRLQLWDIAGQERFGNMTRVYYKEAVGAFIVFDVTRNATFDAVIKWKHDLDSKVQLPDGSPIPCILLANKCDQTKQGLVTTPAKMDEYVKEHGFTAWFETSAKDNINIEESAKALVSKILANDNLIRNDMIDSERLQLAGTNGNNQEKKFCSC
ncbi:unnamed protein product [Diamesa tonsa]